MRALRYGLLGLLVLVLLVLGFAWWVVGTPSGAVWVGGRAQDALAGKLTVGRIEGALTGPLILEEIRYHDAERDMLVTARRAELQLAFRELLQRRIHIEHASLRGLRVDLPPPQDEPREPRNWLDTPVAIQLDRFTLEDAVIRRNEVPLLEVSRARLSGSWTEAGIVIRELALDSPQGEVRLTGNVDQSDYFTGRSQGRFRWTIGQDTFAGAIRLATEETRVNAHLELTEPLVARIDAAVDQRTDWPWKLDADIPAFDPRKLRENVRLERVGMTLSGTGTVDSGNLTGRLLIDDERLLLQPLQFTRTEEELLIERLTLRAAGRDDTVSVTGRVFLLAEPLRAQLTAQWSGLELPAMLIGQALATDGALTFEGNAEAYEASGELTLGPPGQLSEIVFAVRGAPERIEVERLNVVQRVGRFEASGDVRLEPRIAWNIRARASRVDPGALLPDWRGNLSFTLDTTGDLTPEGPDARLRLTRLAGRLRDRPVSGQADLTLRPDRVLAGTMRLRSGSSTVQLSGRRGTEMDAVADIDIASLGDWLPDAAGSVRGRATIRGVWPALAIAGGIEARRLMYAERGIERLTLDADVTNLEQYSGEVVARAEQVAAGNQEWSRVDLRASGNPARHELVLQAAGEPLSFETRITGTHEDERWQGSLERLVLAMQNVTRLELQRPAPLHYAEGSAGIGQACFASEETTLCLSGNRSADGALQATYDIRNLPLALLARMAPTEVPVEVEGAIEGRGTINRRADGTLTGEAAILSSAGRVAPLGEPDTPLLTYEALRLQADLAGNDARIELAGVLGTGGQLAGTVTLARLRSASPTVDGQVRATLPSIAVVEAFTSQLAAVRGRLEVQASANGTLREPRISARARLSEFSSEIPQLGVQLEQGDVTVISDVGGALKLTGRITSGDGEIALEGRRGNDEAITVTVKGEEFLLANIPGARVEASPDLRLRYEEKRLLVSGEVVIPEASINVQRLPTMGRTRASPDVVVVDDETTRERGEGMPIYADVTVVLRREVALSGFGLDATLDGRLTIQEQPGEPTLGSGELRVQGTYKAYGQDLTIESGRLLYAATPLSNPRLDIVAYRPLEDVRPGLRITGSAQRPQITVTSEPPLPEAEALSYLVTGRPLNNVSSAEQGDLLQTAARSIGTAAGNLLARSVGRRLGVDEIGIERSAALGGESAFTVGEYLSPRLFISYGVGLFTPGEIVTLRYQIGRDVQLEASSAPNETRAAIIYEAGGRTSPAERLLPAETATADPP